MRRFRLVDVPRDPLPKRWHRLKPFIEFIRKPVWTSAEVDRVYELINKRGMDDLDLDYLEAAGEPDLFDRLHEMIAEYQKVVEISKLPPPPTAAYLKRQMSIPSYEDRAIALWNLINAGQERRRAVLRGRSKKFKTAKAQYKENDRVFAADERWQALVRYRAMLLRYAPHVANWAAGYRRRHG